MILTKRHYWTIGTGVLLLVAFAVAAAELPRHSRVEAMTVPEGTPIHVTLNQAIGSDQSRAGDHFEATVSEPVLVGDKMVIPAGSRAKGMVVDARQSGRLMGRASLQLALESVEVDSQTYGVHTASSWRSGGNHKKHNWEWIGGGAGGGALIGAIAGGGKGALIGGPIGAGAGTAVAMLTGRKDIRLHAETPLTFKLADPLTIPAKI